MSIYVRRAKPSDKERALWVESQAVRSLKYLERMWDEFIYSPDEPFFIAYLDGEMAGIGKFTLLPDGSAWLETLRVAKRFQGRGVGKAIYLAYLEHAAALKVPALRMYTGVSNYTSAGLAARNGFTLAETFSGADLLAENYHVPDRVPGFRILEDPEKAYELFAPLGRFLVFDRTFYVFDKILINALVAAKMVFHLPENDSAIILGYRMMPERGYNIGAMRGNYADCLAFAHYYGHLMNLPLISFIFPQADSAIRAALQEAHFTPNESDFIVMERLERY